MLAGLAAVLCAGCGAVTRSAPSTGQTHPPSATPPRSRHLSTARLVYSTASKQVVQRQPALGTCHPIGTGLYERPDPSCTPGALNPAVTQATIHSTICAEGWTDTVRPPESITEQEKVASLAAYGETGSLSDYEYDHFVPLELGGATNDSRNLWPEPGASPNPKDTVEDALRAEVCDGQLTLSRAQDEIAANWTALARRSAPAGSLGRWTVTAAYSTLRRARGVGDMFWDALAAQKPSRQWSISPVLRKGHARGAR